MKAYHDVRRDQSSSCRRLRENYEEAGGGNQGILTHGVGLTTESAQSRRNGLMTVLTSAATCPQTLLLLHLSILTSCLTSCARATSFGNPTGSCTSCVGFARTPLAQLLVRISKLQLYQPRIVPLTATFVLPRSAAERPNQR